MVGWNRRFEPLIRNAVEEIRRRGPIVQLVGEFHKNMTRLEALNRFPEHLLDNFLWETPIHAIDLVRFLGASEVVEVHSWCAAPFTTTRTCTPPWSSSPTAASPSSPST